MCGISGFFSSHKSVSGQKYYNAHRLLASRGPDDEGFLEIREDGFFSYCGENSVEGPEYIKDIRYIDSFHGIFGHSRLSVLDISAGGHQPQYTEDKRYAIVYNGEVYNYALIREELKVLGYCFQTDCDTEVVLRAYQEWGNQCFNRFNGMWAIAIYDRRKKELLLSRDRFGIKPLYYAFDTGNTILFASAVKVLRNLLDKTTLNEISIDRYLENSQVCSDGESFFREIHEVPAACCMVFHTGQLQSTFCYWQYRPELHNRGPKQAQEEFCALFEDSIHLRMRSDVEVGSLLSGGLDSNTIVGSLYKNRLLNNRYQTFSAVYENELFSEKRYIEQTQQKLGVCTNYIRMTPNAVLSNMDAALWNAEVPLRAAPMILQYMIYQYIRQHSNVRVVLNGQGADELFGGYTDNYYARFVDLFYQGRFKVLGQEIKKFEKNRKISLYSILRGCLGAARHCPPCTNAFNKITFPQITEAPLPEYLLYDDRASMAFGIEARAPFMDYRLVEFAFSLVSDYKIDASQNKLIVRNYAKNLVPQTILQRKDKMGFTSPQEIWQRQQWKPALDKAFAEISGKGLFDLDRKALCREYKKYVQGDAQDWAKIWRIFCLQHWSQLFA